MHVGSPGHPHTRLRKRTRDVWSGSAILFRKHTVKIERTAPLSRPVPPFLLYGPGLSGHRSRPPPPHGLRCRRSRPAKTRTSGSELAIPNPTSDLLVAPRNVQAGGDSASLPTFFPSRWSHATVLPGFWSSPLSTSLYPSGARSRQARQRRRFNGST